MAALHLEVVCLSFCKHLSKPLLGDGLSFSLKLVANLVLGGGVLLVRADRAEPDLRVGKESFMMIFCQHRVKLIS